MNYLADLKNTNNWRQVYINEKQVVYDTAGGYTPLPAFEIPITFDAQILAVRTLSNNAKFTWRFSGVLSQRISLGGDFDGVPTSSLNYNRLRINRTSMLHLPNYNTDYELLFEPYVWIKHIALTVWEYTGVLTQETSNLITETRENELVRIEEKIDNIVN